VEEVDEHHFLSWIEGGADPQRLALGAAEDHVWFEDRWMVTSLCDE
jgi:hypothetical protein